jgi:hypothetical protein
MLSECATHRIVSTFPVFGLMSSALAWRMVSPYSRSCLLFSLLLYCAGGRMASVLQRRLHIVSPMFRCVTCEFAAPGVLTGSG